MNAQSLSSKGCGLDKHTKYWSNSNGKGLPQMFWDWWKQNQDNKFRVTYSNHANEEHDIEFGGKYHSQSKVRDILKADKWIIDDFYVSDFPAEVFECHYNMDDTSRPRKFIMNLPFYDSKTDDALWHSKYAYTGVFAANNVDSNHLEMISVWARPHGRRGNPNQRNSYEKGTGTPTEFLR